MNRKIIIIVILSLLVGAGIYYIFNKTQLFSGWQNNISNQTDPINSKMSIFNAIDTYTHLDENQKRRVSTEHKYKISKFLYNNNWRDYNKIAESVNIDINILNSGENPKNILPYVYTRLAQLYETCGHNQMVMDTLYSDKNFKKILDDSGGDYELASRYIFKKAYKLLPEPFPAIRIANWYADKLLTNDYENKAQKQLYIDQLLKYNGITETFIEQSPVYKKSYGYWIARNEAALCYIGKNKYCIEYKKDALTKSKWSIILFAYYTAIIDKDIVSAKRLITKNINKFDAEKELNQKYKSDFFVWWNNEINRRGNNRGLKYKAVMKVREFSPEFDTYVRKIEVK